MQFTEKTSALTLKPAKQLCFNKTAAMAQSVGCFVARTLLVDAMHKNKS